MQFDFHERGRASLEVDKIFNESTVTGAYATSPMKLLTPRSRGDCVCTYATNFGGGLVAGDQTRLAIRVGKHARCFLGTQASTKIYRNPHRLPCSHMTCATVEEGGCLSLPPLQFNRSPIPAIPSNRNFASPLAPASCYWIGLLPGVRRAVNGGNSCAFQPRTRYGKDRPPSAPPRAQRWTRIGRCHPQMNVSF